MSDVVYVNPYGVPIEPGQAAGSVKPARKSRDQAAGYHKGFRVLGYPPGVIDAAKREYEARRARIIRANIGAMKPQREPGIWSETAWKQANKPRPVNGRPYEIQSAAVLCLRMAEAAGWTDVHLVELKREPAKPDE